MPGHDLIAGKGFRVCAYSVLSPPSKPLVQNISLWVVLNLEGKEARLYS
jgi:hypothetical protein